MTVHLCMQLIWVLLLYFFYLQVFERMKLVIEPAAACSVAVVLTHQFREMAGPDVKKVGVVLCGGNTDLDKLPWITNN